MNKKEHDEDMREWLLEDEWGHIFMALFTLEMEDLVKEN